MEDKSKKNINYLKEHYNNFIYPDPIVDIDQEFIDPKRHYYDDPTYYWHKIWPEKSFSDKKLEILIAGCGTNQAAVLAKCNPNHSFVGIDLSENSINHHKKLIKKHSIKNIEVICNDFRDVSFDKKFDLIISQGVIHHLDDPGSALKYFNENLSSKGVLSLMVYGDKITGPMNELKNIFSKLELNQSKESATIIRDFFNNFKKDHPASIFYHQSVDSRFDAGIIDFILHKSEKFFSIKNLIKLLANNNLIIKNFHDGNIRSLTKFFLYNEELIKRIRLLPVEDQWELGQTLNWSDHRLAVFCTKKENVKDIINYSISNLDDYFICYRDGTEFKIEHNLITIKTEIGDKYLFNVPVNDLFLWNLAFSGKIKLHQLLSAYTQIDQHKLRDFFLILVENGFVDVTLHKVEVDRA
jgi:SAM-dependent methyltransferase